MISQIKKFFTTRIQEPDVSPVDSVQLATAALLVEVMAVDHHPDEKEESKIRQLLQSLFLLSDEDVLQLFELAYTECRESTSLYPFTRLVNRYFTHDEKFTLMLNLWKVAYADGQLDKYEEGIIRKISELIHVSHSDFIRAKHTALNRFRV